MNPTVLERNDANPCVGVVVVRGLYRVSEYHGGEKRVGEHKKKIQRAMKGIELRKSVQRLVSSGC
jgi:hypothetical protein